MTLVDTSVWIDFFRGVATPQVEKLDRLFGIEPLAIGDLILVEVLQGIRDPRAFDRVRKTFAAFTPVDLAGSAIAVQAATNFRTLRGLGITVRKTIATLIATRCIQSGFSLLHADRDFDAFETHLGLRTVACGT